MERSDLPAWVHARSRAQSFYYRSETRRGQGVSTKCKIFPNIHFKLQFWGLNMPFRAREEKKLCRLQIWNFSPENLPELSLIDEGLLQKRVKLNNDSSCSISSDFSRIACFVQYPETRQRLQLVVISLSSSSLGETLWSRDFNNDALCVTIRLIIIINNNN